jgi:outer membrane protein
MNEIGRSIALLFLTAAMAAGALGQSAENEHTLTLREAVTLALENSRDLRLARVQYAVALNEVRVDHAAFLPNLYTGGGYVYTYGFPSVPGAGPPAVFQLAYTQSVFNPLLKGQQRAAEERAKSQQAAINHTRDDVMLRTASTYLELAEVRHLESLMNTDQASAEKILEITRERVQANQELPIEQTRAELTAARIRERLLKLQDRDDILTQQMRDLTAIPDSQSITVETEEPALASGLEQSQVTELSIENDRAVQEAENERAARQKLLRGAHLSYWPTADLVGQYSVLSKFNNYNLFYKTFQRNNINVGVEITIPLFAAKTGANVALAKSALNEAEVELSNRRQEVRIESQQSTRESRELEASREVARLDLKLAQQDVELTQARLEDGKVTLRDLEQARLVEGDRWMAFLDADLAWQRSQLKILEATGQLAKALQQ